MRVRHSVRRVQAHLVGVGVPGCEATSPCERHIQAGQSHLVEQHADVAKEVAAVAGDGGATVRLVAADAPQQVVVVQQACQGWVGVRVRVSVGVRVGVSIRVGIWSGQVVVVRGVGVGKCEGQGSGESRGRGDTTRGRGRGRVACDDGHAPAGSRGVPHLRSTRLSASSSWLTGTVLSTRLPT